MCPGFENYGLDPKQPPSDALTKKPTCPNALVGAATDEALMKTTLEILERRNIIGVTSGPLLDRWRAVGGDRIIPSATFGFWPGAPSPERLREGFNSKRFLVFGEVAIQYQGVSPSNARFEPYLAVAESADIPVGIHMGPGPVGAPYIAGFGNYRARLHSPLELEDALVRHPKLRVYIMHAGWPMLDDLLAVLWAHPQVHVDVGIICYALPRDEFNRYLQRIVQAGFSSRVMFGSDQMNWPAAIEQGIEAIESATFLNPQQKRDILYNNAARFLRLTPEQIARHHGR
jgi:hypothetical protein